jgi:hypothetical protein
MAFALNQPDEKDTLQARWAPMRLRGRPGLQLSLRFDYTDDLQSLVLSVRIEPGGWSLKYGMSRWDLGSYWDGDNRAERRLKVLAQAELRKDLFLFFDAKKAPCSLSQIVWIDSRGRSIP